MPRYVASIEVYFAAPNRVDAEWFADALSDLVAEYEQPTQVVTVTGVTCGCALDAKAS